MRALGSKMTAVGFEPTQLSLVELESTPLDHSGKLSWKFAQLQFITKYFRSNSRKRHTDSEGICTPATSATSEDVVRD